MVYKVSLNIIVTTKQKPIIDTQKVKKIKPKVKRLLSGVCAPPVGSCGLLPLF